MSNPSHSDIMRKLKEIKGIKELLEKAKALNERLLDGLQGLLEPAADPVVA